MGTGAITDVAGILVGHADRLGDGWATGVTAVLAPPGTVGGVDVRGGGPGTRETDLLDPSNLVQHVDAVLLCGGSAYGLAAADGAMRWLAGRGRGVPVGAAVVPIVPAAVVFDLSLNDWVNVPDAAFGTAACDAASSTTFAGDLAGQGCVGAGTGAIAGRLKGGVGTAAVTTAGGRAVGALAVANPLGDVVDPETGLPWSRSVASRFGLRAPDPAHVRAAAAAPPARSALNTTIGVVATDAALTKSQCRRLAMVAHDGLARAVRPAHSLHDGDTVFALATGAAPGPVGPAALDELCAAAADAFEHAVVAGVLAATSVGGVRAYREVFPSAVWRLS